MILADTSIWIDHMRSPVPRLAEVVDANELLMHPMVIGELACGNLSNRERRLGDWQRFPMIPEAENEDVLSIIESRRLMGRGIGFIDAHLLCAVLNHANALLWTRDGSLNRVAKDLGVAFSEDTWRKDGWPEDRRGDT